MAMPSRPPSRIAGRIEPIACAAVLYVLSAALGGCAQTSKPAAGGAAVPTQAVAARMVEHGAQHGESFLSHTQTTAIRNMLGGARGVFLAPDMTGEAAIVGVQRGTGFLLRRHGKEWSDPVFFSLTEASIGYQAGVKTSHTLILLMTDTAVTNFVKGTSEVGGSGGFALGPYGLGVSGTGEIQGGLEMIVLSTNKGAFVGGGWAEVKTTLVRDLNDGIYGANTDASKVLASPGGTYQPAIKLRQRLSEMVVKAWE